IETRSICGDEYLSDKITDKISQALKQQHLTHTHIVALSGPRRISMKSNLKNLLHPNDRIVLVWINVREDILYKRYNNRLLSEGQQPVEKQDFLGLLRREEQYGLDISATEPDVYLDNNTTLDEFRVCVAEFVKQQMR